LPFRAYATCYRITYLTSGFATAFFVDIRPAFFSFASPGGRQDLTTYLRNGRQANATGRTVRVQLFRAFSCFYGTIRIAYALSLSAALFAAAITFSLFYGHTRLLTIHFFLSFGPTRHVYQNSAGLWQSANLRAAHSSSARRCDIERFCATLHWQCASLAACTTAPYSVGRAPVLLPRILYAATYKRHRCDCRDAGLPLPANDISVCYCYGWFTGFLSSELLRCAAAVVKHSADNAYHCFYVTHGSTRRAHSGLHANIHRASGYALFAMLPS